MVDNKGKRGGRIVNNVVLIGMGYLLKCGKDFGNRG